MRHRSIGGGHFRFVDLRRGDVEPGQQHELDGILPGLDAADPGDGKIDIRIGGLPCIRDASGPCANAVKDSQRTKTSPDTLRTLSVIWGTKAQPGRTLAATEWYVELLDRE